MKRFLVALLFLNLPSMATECQKTLPMSEVEKVASSYVGKINSVKLSKNKNGECYYRVYGDTGHVTIDAQSGELLKFTKKRDK
ncbi:MAG: curli assembly protein CsgG [Sulfurihydrogenibium sp.]